MHRIGLVWLLLASGPGCGGVREPAWVPVAPSEGDAVVARVGEVPIFASDVAGQVRRYLSAEALSDGRTASGSRLPELRKQAVEEIVATELLADAARARGYLRDPEVVEARRQALVHRWLRREFEPRTREQDIPEPEIRVLYDRARDSFVHGRLVEIGVLNLATGERMRSEARAERAQAARDLAVYVKAHPPKTLDEFRAIAHDPVWASRQVQYARIWQGDGKPFLAAVQAEVDKLTRPDQMTGLVEDEKGYHIIRYISERAPVNTSFAEVRSRIAHGMYPRWRAKRFLDAAAKMASGHAIETYPHRLALSPLGARPDEPTDDR